MVKGRICAVLGVFVLLFMTNAHADTIYLKNGKSLQGLLSKEDAGSVEVNVGNGTVVFQRQEIQRIVRSTPQETEEIKKNWDMAKSQNEKTKVQDMAEKEKAEEKWDALVEDEIRRGAEKRDKTVNAKVVPVVSNKSGSIAVDGVLNAEVHVTLILDTGCPVVLLTAHTGQRLGIDLTKIHNAPEVMVLDGKHKVHRIILKSVKLGDLEAKNVAAEVLLEDSAEIRHHLKDGLLGMSFLQRFEISLDQKKKELTFQPRR